MSFTPTSVQRDARELREHDLFFRCGDANLPLRRVLRTRQTANLTEILHGHVNAHGGLEYTKFNFGLRVLVPTGLQR